MCETIERKARQGRLPKAVIPVHLYGQSADLDPTLVICARYAIPVIEDAAEALGATYRGRAPGTLGWAGIFSFNGNKIITTSGGGMLVSADKELIEHARKLATQARDPASHYQHSEIGYNYRLSNVLRPKEVPQRSGVEPPSAVASCRCWKSGCSAAGRSSTSIVRPWATLRQAHAVPQAAASREDTACPASTSCPKRPGAAPPAG